MFINALAPPTLRDNALIIFFEDKKRLAVPLPKIDVGFCFVFSPTVIGVARVATCRIKCYHYRIQILPYDKILPFYIKKITLILYFYKFFY